MQGAAGAMLGPGYSGNKLVCHFHTLTHHEIPQIEIIRAVGPPVIADQPSAIVRMDIAKPYPLIEHIAAEHRVIARRAEFHHRTNRRMTGRRLVQPASQ